MALHAATLIRDGGTLQIGIGSFADALAHALILRHTRNAEFRALRRPARHAAAPRRRADALRGRPVRLHRDAGRRLPGAAAGPASSSGAWRCAMAGGAILHAGFFVGNHAFYRELRDMPRAELEEIAMTAISFTNTLHGDADLKRAAAAARPLRQHGHGGDADGRGVVRPARGRARRQRPRRPARPGRHGARAGRRALHHRRAQHAPARTARPSPTSSGATPTPPCRGRCATSSSPSTASPTSRAKATATPSPRCWAWPTAPSSRRLIQDAQRVGKLERSFAVPLHAAANTARAHRGGPGTRPPRRPAARLPAGLRHDRRRAGPGRAAADR